MPLLPVLLLTFIAVPLVELYVILQVGDAIGAVPTIALLAADSALGAVLLRGQGRSVWRQFNAVMRSGRVPQRELLDGVAVIFGGALLLTPGFITDVVGLLLLLPPSRALIRGLVARRIGQRIAVAGFAAERGPRADTWPAAGDEPVEGTGRDRPDERRRGIEP